jgi:biopolymer transport protein ExbD
MKIKRKNEFHAEVSTSSLNDIMFFLLLFFLIISTITNPNVIKVLLPRSKASQTLNKQSITLTVTDSKKYYVNQHEIPFSSLEPELLKATAGITEPTIVLHLHQNLTIQDLADVMQIGAKNKIKMVLATSKSKE